MKGELINLNDNSNENSLEKDSFLKASLLSRFLIVASGPLANLILGLLLITSLYALNGRYISSTVINSVIDSRPAQLAGILPNDKVISIDGKLVKNFQEIKDIVERDNDVLNINVIPIDFFDERSNKLVSRIWITAKPMVLSKLSFFEAFKAGIYDTYKLTTDWLIGFKSILTLNIDKKDVVGPIGIAKISGSSLDQGLFSIIFLMAILSINLGLINLLPIPALDGGYILLYAYELIFKKPLPSKIQTLLLKFGFIFLLMLMFLVTAFDLGF